MAMPYQGLRVTLNRTLSEASLESAGKQTITVKRKYRQTARRFLLSMFRYGVATSTRICLLFPLSLRFLEFSPAIT